MPANSHFGCEFNFHWQVLKHRIVPLIAFGRKIGHQIVEIGLSFFLFKVLKSRVNFLASEFLKSVFLSLLLFWLILLLFSYHCCYFDQHCFPIIVVILINIIITKTQVKYILKVCAFAFLSFLLSNWFLIMMAMSVPTLSFRPYKIYLEVEGGITC